MKSENDQLLDIQIEVVQASIYCDIIKKIIAKHRSMSLIKIIAFSYIIKKREYLKGSLYRGNNKLDVLLKFLSQGNGLFDDLCVQMPYIMQSIDILVKDGACEVHEGELIYDISRSSSMESFDAFTESALQESKMYSDRQFLREVISIV